MGVLVFEATTAGAEEIDAVHDYIKPFFGRESDFALAGTKLTTTCSPGLLNSFLSDDIPRMTVANMGWVIHVLSRPAPV